MHPVLFEIAGRPIYAYGVMLGLSLIIGWQIVTALGKRDGTSTELLGDAYLTAAICGVIGARALYVLTNLDEFQSPREWIDISGGGLVAYGGFIGGMLGAAIFLRIKKSSFWLFADPVAPAIALGLLLTRVGCYLYGCDFGTRLPDNAPAWLAKLGTFPNWSQLPGGLHGSPAFLHHMDIYGLSRDAAYSYPVHPTQLYEGLLGLILAVVCLLMWKRRKFAGQVLLTLTMCYAAARFGIEYLRGDPERGAAFGFSTSQLISLILGPVAGVVYSVLARRAREATA